MKRLYIAALTLCLLTAAIPETYAQKKNSIRAGAGMNMIIETINGPSHLGGSLYIEYSRRFNKYFSLAGNLYTGSLDFSGYEGHFNLALGVAALVRPFAFTESLKWIETGIAAICKYRLFRCTAGVLSGEHDPISYFGKNHTYIFHEKYLRPGIAVPVRLYIIDNDRFELMAFCNMEFVWGNFYMLGPYDTDAGLMFGVKF